MKGGGKWGIEQTRRGKVSVGWSERSGKDQIEESAKGKKEIKWKLERRVGRN